MLMYCFFLCYIEVDALVHFGDDYRDRSNRRSVALVVERSSVSMRKYSTD